MTEALKMEGISVKREEKILTLVCVLMALLFLGLAGLNYMSAGNLFSVDSLFFTTVAGMLAVLFLLVPALTMMAKKRDAKAPETRSSAAIAARANTPVLNDAKGRPVPPDVRKMMEQMKEPETKNP